MFCRTEFAHFLGINQPQFQQRGDWGNYEYRMVRYPRGSAYAYCEHRRPTRFAYWSPYQTLEVAGEWAPTMKAAKASYKEALRRHQAKGRAEKKRLAA